jgi:FkbM family methyltransferase
LALPDRPIAFILAASNHGSMIVNRNDYHSTSPGQVYGVGHQILQRSSFDAGEISALLALLTLRRRYFGDGVLAIDGGANIGVHTVEWARHMHGWGRVLSFEAQEIIYYALAGNIVLNNCLNARARLAALGESPGELSVPQPNYFAAASFGSLELRQTQSNEFIGQRISYDPATLVSVPMVSLDSLALDRVDLIKLDIEGMEVEGLRGARETLLKCRPMLAIEVIKSDQRVIKEMLDGTGYQHFPAGLNLLAIHGEDPAVKHVSHRDGKTFLSG